MTLDALFHTAAVSVLVALAICQTGWFIDYYTSNWRATELGWVWLLKGGVIGTVWWTWAVDEALVNVPNLVWFLEAVAMLIATIVWWRATRRAKHGRLRYRP